MADIEIVECSPPYDNADVTSPIGIRVVCDVPATLVDTGALPHTGRPSLG